MCASEHRQELADRGQVPPEMLEDIIMEEGVTVPEHVRRWRRLAFNHDDWES